MRPSLLFFTVLLGLLSGCDENPPYRSIPVSPDFVANGVYILHEGSFGDPTGARLSVYDIDADTVYHDIFEAANGGAHLGSLGDDIEIVNGVAYILMSSSENLSLINLTDHRLLQNAVYPGSVPHDLLVDPIRGKIYLTRLFSSSILVVDLTTLVPQDTIAVGANPMGMVSVGSRLFVCNSGFGTGNTVSVIDVVSQLVEATLTVSDGPTDALLGKDGLVWISCTGNGFGVPPTPGKLFAINPATLAVEDSIVSSLSFVGPLASTIDGTLYLLAGSAGMSDGGSLFRIEPSGGSLTSVVPGAYYALGVDPTTDRIYLSDVNGFVADGEVSIYEPDGTFVGTLMAGKIPGAFAFKH